MGKTRHDLLVNTSHNHINKECQYYRIKNHKPNIFGAMKITIGLFFILNSVKTIKCSVNLNETSVNEIEEGRSYFENFYRNGTFYTGNVLWDNILNQCTVKPTISCLQKNVYSYVDESLEAVSDINVSSAITFKKNNVDIKKFNKEANAIYLTGSKDEEVINEFEKGRSFDEENEIDDDLDESGIYHFF